MDGLDLILPGALESNISAVTGGTQHYDNAYYDGGLTTYASTNIALVANRLYATPLVVPAGTYDRIGFHLGTSAAAGKLMRCGLYLPGANGLPGAVALDPGADVAADSASAYMLQAISLVVPRPTLYYATVWSDGAPVIGGWTVPGRNWFGHLINSAAKVGMCYVTGNTYGAFPASYGTPTAYAASLVPRIFLRAA